MVNFSIKKHSQRFVNALSAWTGLGEIRYRFQRERLGWAGTRGLQALTFGLIYATPPPQQCGSGLGGAEELDGVFQL